MPPLARGSIKEENDEDHIPSNCVTACAIFRASHGSCANQRKKQSSACRQSAAGIRDRGPRDRSSALELRLHDRPGAKRVRPARMVLWQRRRARAIHEWLLTRVACFRLKLPTTLSGCFGSNSDELSQSRWLPGYLRKRTLSLCVGMSQRCHNRKCPRLNRSPCRHVVPHIGSLAARARKGPQRCRRLEATARGVRQ